jgi:hypothetical protein
MAEFCMKIAGHTAKVISLFESTPQYFRAYLTENPPEFSVTVTAGDLLFEQAELDREAREEGFKRRVFTDPFLERAAIQRQFASFLLHRGILLIHGSAIAVDGVGYLFVARSGTGKSTHTRLWRQLLGDRAVMVNDDKPFVQLGETVQLHGSPWSGKHGLDSNLSVPLRGICLLERGEENYIWPVDRAEAVVIMHKYICLPQEDYPPELLQHFLQQIGDKVGVWQMRCNREMEAAYMAHGTMSAI